MAERCSEWSADTVTGVGAHQDVKSSCVVEDTGPAMDDLAALTHVLLANRKKLPPTSFSLAPAVPLPLWQRVALSTIKRVEYDVEDQRQAASAQAKLGKELTKYHADVHAREELTRRQQREARAQLGGRLALASRRFWARRGEMFQQLQRVEFDLLKRHRDKRKQEDLLRETEDLTKKLLDSLLGDKPKEAKTAQPQSKRGSAATHTQETADELFRKTGNDGSFDIESSLELLDTEGGRRPLRHYQRSALHWMIHLFENRLNGILADEMGLGKTVQTIALLCYYAQYKNDWGPHLIVVPTTVVLNWKAELQRWAPGLKVLTYMGSVKERVRLRQGWTGEDAFHVCVTSYNLVVQDRRVFRIRPWGFLVLDEAHQVKNFMSKKWQSLFDLQAEYRLLLTGTPLQNSVMELWSLFHFLLPFASAFRSNDEFKEWFSNPMDDMITGRSSLNEDIVRRLQALIRPFMLRRLKRDVETQLPTKTEKVVLCRLSRRQRSLYDDYMQLAETKQRLQGGGAGGVLSVLLGLRKVCDHPDLFEERPTISPLALDRFAAITLHVPRAVLLQDNDFRGCYRFPSFRSLCVVNVNADGPSPTGHLRKKSERVGGDRGGVGKPREDDLFACFDWLPCRALSVRFHVNDAVSACVSLCCHAGTFDDAARHEWASRFGPPPVDDGSGDVGLEMLDSRLQRARTELAGLRACVPNSPQNAIRKDGFLSAYGLVLKSALQVSDRIHRGNATTRRLQLQRQQEEATSIVYHVPRAAVFMSELKDAVIKQPNGCCRGLCPTVAERASAVYSMVRKVAVYVPAARAVFAPRLHWALPIRRPGVFLAPARESLAPLIGFVAKERERFVGDKDWRRDLFDGSSFLRELWPMHVRRCFSFPDKSLLVHDCGKLQFLATALKQLRQEGHRMLIFTQFVHMLNILERFLALIGVAYLRLDGSTKAEVRQAMVDRFNEDTKVTCMILSTRSGGIGLNLTGADTVIFYDSDWNPTMDLQAQDRCHRIGQTRPVTIYRLISEHTVEEAILEKARERKKLNNVVIRGGQFHTIAGVSEEYDDTAAAFAALSDPVNLRSFFHDYDEDVTLPTPSSGGAVEPVAEDILAEMGKVEDAEDRDARAQVELEMEQRKREEAAEQGDEDEEQQAVQATASFAAASDRHSLTEGDLPFSRKDALAAQEACLSRVLGAAPRSPTSAQPETAESGHPELVEAGLMPVVRKRQRELLSKARSPLDRLLTARYGVCHESDAWVRYGRLCDDYESKLLDENARYTAEEGDAPDHIFPAFRARFEL